MQVSSIPEEEEAQLSQIARFRGTDAEHLVRTTALRLLDENCRFDEGVRRGLGAAERGEFVEHAEALAGLQTILHP